MTVYEGVNMVWVWFEHPVWIIAVTTGAGGGLMFIGSRVGRRGVRKAGIAVLLCGAAALVLERLVATPSERLVMRCFDLVRSVEDGDLARIRATMAEDVRADGSDREQFMLAIEQALARFHPEDIRLRDLKVALHDPGRADVEFRAACRIITSSEIHHGVVTRWRLSFARVGKNWLVHRVELLPEPFSPVRSLRDIRR